MLAAQRNFKLDSLNIGKSASRGNFLAQFFKHGL